MWKLAIASSRLKVVSKSSSLSNVQLFLSLDSTSHSKKQEKKVTFKLSNISWYVVRCWLNPSVAENYWLRPRLCLNPNWHEL